MTSVMMYRIDKIVRRSTESARETAIFLIATLAAYEFLGQTKKSQQIPK